LRIIGTALEPAEVTSLLGREPTCGFAKGDRNIGTKGREYAPHRTGMWLLKANGDTSDAETSILDLLAGLPDDPYIWTTLAAKFELILSVGLFMNKTNEGFALSSRILEALGRREIAVDLDIYAPIRAPDRSDPCACGSGMTYADCCIPGEPPAAR